MEGRLIGPATTFILQSSGLALVTLHPALQQSTISDDMDNNYFKLETRDKSKKYFKNLILLEIF